MSKLLINEHPVIVLPSLAQKLGLNEAIFVQQLHYWLQASTNMRNGHKWVYNTYEAWQQQLPFISVRTLKRVVARLEEMGLIISDTFNKSKMDKTKWYRIDYQQLDTYMASSTDQNDSSIEPNWHDEEATLSGPIPESSSMISPENKITVPPQALEEANAYCFFEENGFGTIGSYMAEKIALWINELSEELVIEALKIATERGVKKWNYVERILLDWVERNIKRVEEVQALELTYQKQKKKVSPSRQETVRRTEHLPDWFHEDRDVVVVEKEFTSNVDQEERKQALAERLKQYQ